MKAQAADRHSASALSVNWALTVMLTQTQPTWNTSALTVSSRSRKRCTSTGATWG